MIIETAPTRVVEVKRRQCITFDGGIYRVFGSVPSGRRNGWELSLSWRNGRVRIVLPDTASVDLVTKVRRGNQEGRR